jgi:flagellar protein FliO/FliZ
MRGLLRHAPTGLAAWLALIPASSLAAEPVSSEFEGVSGMLSVMLSLVVVLAVVFAVAWGMRRMQGLAGMRNANMKIVAQMALSTRERLVVVEVGGEQLLLGVGPGVIRTLHKLEEPIRTEEREAGTSFRDRLMESLQRRGERD